MDERGVFKFDGTDYEVWRSKMWVLLDSKDLGFVVGTKARTKRSKNAAGDGEEESEEASKELCEKKAKSLLLLALDRKIVRLVLNCNSAKKIWDKLHSIYAQRSEIDQLVLLKRFYGLKMDNRESISEYIARAESIKMQLDDAKCTLDEAMMVGKIVEGSPPRFMNYMSNWCRSGTKKINAFLPQLMAEESHIASMKPPVASAHISEASRSLAATRRIISVTRRMPSIKSLGLQSPRRIYRRFNVTIVTSSATM